MEEGKDHQGTNIPAGINLVKQVNNIDVYSIADLSVHLYIFFDKE